MIKKITVKGEFRNRTYLYEVEDGIDFFDAVKKASADFVNTPDGRKIYYKKGSFSWNDFASVPEYICRKYGLRKLNFEESIVKNNESLINENSFVLTPLIWHELKRTILGLGSDVISDFCGYEVPGYCTKTELNILLDKTKESMADDSLDFFYQNTAVDYTERQCVPLFSSQKQHCPFFSYYVEKGRRNAHV